MVVLFVVGSVSLSLKGRVKLIYVCVCVCRPRIAVVVLHTQYEYYSCIFPDTSLPYTITGILSS